jgi:hypothetical protein
MRVLVAALGLATILAPVSLFAQEDEGQGRQRTELRGGPGPYRVDMWYTENAFIMRKVRPEFFFQQLDGGSRWTAPVEAEWALVPDFALTLDVPLNGNDIEGDSSEAGLGDISVGAKAAAINRPNLILSFAGVLEMPTGDEEKGLGEGSWNLELAPRLWLPFGPQDRVEFQVHAPVTIPLESGESTTGEVNVALAWTTVIAVTVLVEGITEFSFDDGDPSYWVAPGFQWQLPGGFMVGASLRLPLDGPETEGEDYVLAIGVLREWELPFEN